MTKSVFLKYFDEQSFKMTHFVITMWYNYDVIKSVESVNEMAKKSKYDRVLSIYSMLDSGKKLSKQSLASDFGVNERTIQRDIDDIRAFLTNNTLNINYGKAIIFDRAKKCYRMVDKENSSFTSGELLAVCKILLESRSLVKEEMEPIIEKILSRCTDASNKKAVTDLIRNEQFHYIEPHHGKKLTDMLWTVGTAIKETRYIEIVYERLKGKEIVKRKLKPVGIMVSEFYFYLAAFIDDIDKSEHFDNPNDLSPTIYRIDRIWEIRVLDEKFYIPYKDKFEEGEFRKRVQFMYGGTLNKTVFKYCGLCVDAVLDRLPTAKIVKEEDGVYTIEAETFGKGIDMWLKSQGENITKG